MGLSRRMSGGRLSLRVMMRTGSEQVGPKHF
jgi:hypothetical protein